MTKWNNRYYLGKTETKKQGARWDKWAGLWYVDVDPDPNKLDEAQSRKHKYSITSDSAYVASTVAACWRCRKETKVICIYCEVGIVNGKTYKEIIISNIRAMDDALEAQLKGWPCFHYGVSWTTGEALFANHCQHCEELQDDYFLHCKPEGAFFRMKAAAPDTIQLNPLEGRIRLDGDEGFEP